MGKFDARRQRWLERLSDAHLDGFLVTHPPNLLYLFNFRGSTGTVLGVFGESHLVVDSRYIEQAGQDSVGCRLVLATQSVQAGLKQLLENFSRATGKHLRIGLEATHIPYDLVLKLQSWQPSIEWIPTTEVIEELRMLKDEEEIETIQRAFEIASTGYDHLAAQIRPGMTEIEVAGILEFELRKAGSEGLAFDTIVASGARSSLPHACTTSKKIQGKEIVLIDFGARYGGYCSDLTRIHLFPGADLPEIYSIVQEAQERALSVIQPGRLSSEIDAAARQFITGRGYGDFFGHGTGHGLGLEVHELPAISSLRPRELQEAMVFTVEPGIYLPGRFGVRIEDAVAVTSRGYRLLSTRDSS